ncbi:VWA domain-containing protein [Ruegeria lacuscaerulensis]|uniref:VWA domain-containing protein n=1 Tax=Ruegeria lacuscaerulensis TaxID=55218 RepID=UPI00147E5BE1|nr:VWA domain-containing protein [Ruegeria lacuscaerulensis]
MSDLLLAMSVFHFLRPLWLLLVPVIVGLWWLTRRRRSGRSSLSQGIAPHLQAAMEVGRNQAHRIRPIDGVALTLLLLAAAAAGPTWSRQPNPLVAQSAPVAVVLKVTKSMDAIDIAPSRLERGKQKIRDFLDLRAGGRSGLVAYAGSAHVVVPMTEDASIILPYLEGLSPDVMPKEGADFAQALSRAQALIEDEGGGALLLVADGLDPADVSAVETAPMPVAVLSMLPEGTRDRGLDALGNRVIAVQPDGSDIRRLDRTLNASYRQSLLENSDDPWLDRGPLLAWPAALLLLLWFRRGWTMHWGAAVFALMLMAPGQARADGLADWFWTPDQQGQRAYDRKDYTRASELFGDPLWRGWAMYRAGRYAEAVQVLDRVDTAQAAMIQGLSNIRNRAYRDGVRSFETALTRDPDYPGAAENLEIAKQIVAYVEAAQEAQDTQDQTELRADDVTYDNEENKGQELQVDLPQEDAAAGLQSAEQWMNSVDTETGDFLKSRFLLEATQAAAEGEQ